MSVMEIVNQVKTMPTAEQLELFREIHRLEAEQEILMQFGDVMSQPIQKEFIEITEDQVDDLLKLLEREGIKLP